MPGQSLNKLCMAKEQSENILNKKLNKNIIKWSTFQARCLKMISDFEANEEDLFVFKHKIESYGVELVDPQAYYEIIKKPMYLKKVCFNIKTGMYKDEFDVIDDINLIFDNAIKYNHKRTNYHKIAIELQMKFLDIATEMMKSIGYCCGSSYKRSPQNVTCNGAAKNCFIKLGSVYHTFNEYTFCDNCFKKQDEMIKLENKHAVKKSDFQDKELTDCVPDLYITCAFCLRRFHRVCVLYFEKVDEEFICVNCSAVRDIKTIQLRVSALPQNNCSIFLQNQLNKNGLNEAGKVTIKVLSDQVMSISTYYQYSNHVGEFNITYSNRVVFAFQEVNGDDVCFFGVYLQVYDADCGIPGNRKSLYLSYLDSVNLKHHVHSRTKIFQQVLLGLFDYYKLQDYKKVYIWSCPPKKRTDYIFNVKPVDQKIPNLKRLTTWYHELMQTGIKNGVIKDFMNIFQHAKHEKWNAISDLPYYDGDLLPMKIEEIIKESKDELEKVNKKLLVIYLDLNSPCSTDEKRDQMTKNLNRLRNWTLNDEIMKQTMKLLKFISTDYFVVILDKVTTEESNITEEINDNTIKSCEFINNRHKFMEYFVENFYEFSDIRQSKYSSFMMIYELYRAHGMCKICLQLNVLNYVTVVGLTCQSCRDKAHVRNAKISKKLTTIEIAKILMNNYNDGDQLMLDQTTKDPFHSINFVDILALSPFVRIERLTQDFIATFTRKKDQTNREKLSVESKVIKKRPSLKKFNTNIGNKSIKTFH